MSAYLKWIVPLTLLYIALTSNIEPLNWIVGVLIALVVVALIRPNSTPIHWPNLPRTLAFVVLFMLTLLWDLIVSGLQVARLVLQSNPDINQGIVAIPDATNVEWITTVSAEAITLTPGELVVEMGRDGTLYTHTLDVAKTLENAAALQAERARQLEEIGQ
jgi:multisubunit Na+/H+ antiporter MnhE subunit